MSLVVWSWLFLALYIAGMVGIGLFAQRRVRHADDFATARSAYGPLFLALAFAASTASGATFLGTPALGYEWGFAAQWGNVLYPMGVYLGVLVSMRLIASSGHRFGNRSIPEYLGDRYRSDGIRVLVSMLSLVLLFYLAGQLVSGLVMFEVMLGLSQEWALVITTLVLLIYVTLGGAHADIITDGLQGLLMLVLSAVVIVMVLVGLGVDGGFGGVVESLRSQDADLVAPLNPNTALYHSWWSILAILLAHVPLGLLPHLGNKLWALEGSGRQKSFVWLAFAFGLILAMLALAGLLARAMMGDALFAPGTNMNAALPLLFIELFPTWLAALVGVGILCAVMSTADGLVVSSSQIVANDLYRRTLAPRLHPHLAGPALDRRVLALSRAATVGALAISMGMAWALLDVNIALIVWIGTGGMMAAFAGPLVIGALWRGVTKQGAYAGLITGFGTFVVLHTGAIDPAWLPSGPLHAAANWLAGEAPNPFSCAAIGELVSVTVTCAVSKVTQPLPDAHLDEMFGAATERASA